MKQILIILGLFASVSTFAQSPRIKLNQITKDTVKGSVLISSPTDSGMVYSRDFYVAYGADTVLILYGDTLAATSGIISSVLSDGVTITGNGTSGNELKVDTSTVISTIQGLVDTLTARGYLTANQTITLSGDVTGSGTTAIEATVVDDSHNHIISNVDFLQDSLNAKANDSDLNNYLLTSNYIVDSTRINATGDTAYYYQNGDLIGTGAIAGGIGIGSGTVTSITAGTYLSGGTITTSGTIALDTASAGLKTYISENIGTVDLASEVTGTLPVANGGTGATTLTSGAFLKGNGTSAVSGSSNLSETADTVYVAKYLDVDTSTLYVDATNNRVGIGTSSPQAPLHFVGNIVLQDADTTSGIDQQFYVIGPNQTGAGANGAEFAFGVRGVGSGSTSQGPAFAMRGNLHSRFTPPYSERGGISFLAGYVYQPTSNDGTIKFYTGEANSSGGILQGGLRMIVMPSGNVGIGTTSPSYDLHVVDDIFASDSIIGTSFVGTSDSRLKQDIELIYNGLDNVLKLNPVSYRYITDINNVNKRFGFIAQEVEAYLPNLVSERFDGMKLLNYLDIIPLNTKAIQEQQAIIESQATEIETLKTLITELSNRLQILENK